jgi:hypothetical protein
MKYKNQQIEKLFKHLSQVSIEAYKDPFLISNLLLSKQESCGQILENYLAGKEPPKLTFIFATKKIFLYLTKNISCWFFSILTAILHKFSGQKFSIEDKNNLILLDTYFVKPKIIEGGEFTDNYFPGLAEHLKKNKKEYVYIPKWYGSRLPFDSFRVFRILKKDQNPVLTQYQILRMRDYLKTLWFFILYPFSVFRLLKNLESSYEDKLINYAIWDVFDGVVIEHYMRFLLGQRLSLLLKGKIKCLSWYENLPIDKNFYSGLRHLPNKTEIVGIQPYTRPNTIMNIFPDEQEIPFNVVPDKILVNGPGYCFDSEQIHVDIGPSWRYTHLFQPTEKNIKKDSILVLMPYWDFAISYILEVIQVVNWPAHILIKFHPTTQWEKYKAKIPVNSSITNEALPLLLPKGLIVIGHSSGALIEAAALGIPVIDIQCPKNFNHDYMPEVGRGVLWDKAENAKEVDILFKKFMSTLQTNRKLLKEEGKKIRSFCFSEPTEESINLAFELN